MQKLIQLLFLFLLVAPHFSLFSKDHNYFWHRHQFEYEQLVKSARNSFYDKETVFYSIPKSVPFNRTDLCTIRIIQDHAFERTIYRLKLSIQEIKHHLFFSTQRTESFKKDLSKEEYLSLLGLIAKQSKNSIQITGWWGLDSDSKFHDLRVKLNFSKKDKIYMTSTALNENGERMLLTRSPLANCTHLERLEL